MDLESQPVPMADRIIQFGDIPKRKIQELGLTYLLEDDYMSDEGIWFTSQEMDHIVDIQTRCNEIFRSTLQEMLKENLGKKLNIPSKMVDLIHYSFEKKHIHLTGRFDFAGGIAGLPIKLLEFNADTPTMLPESSIIQEAYDQFLKVPSRQNNNICRLLETAFNRLTILEPNRHKSLLCTSFGHDEDIANSKFIGERAKSEDWEVEYADLPEVEFAQNEGIFVEHEDGSSTQFDYLYKLFPWEFPVYEEPELLDDLHNLILSDLVYVMNPAYSFVLQNKAFLVHVHDRYPNDFILNTQFDPHHFQGKEFVSKVLFGRMGENITIFNGNNEVVEQTSGDFEHFDKIYQEFAHLYKDDEGDVYQLGAFHINDSAAGVSLRRAEKLIVDEDAQFVPHYIKS